MTTCLMVGAHPPDFTNFRWSLLRAMRERGVRVIAIANGRDAAVESALADIGVEYRAIRIARAGLNPFVDMRTLRALRALVREVRPDVVFSFMIKPIIYASWIARLAGVSRIYAMVEGLGTPFMRGHSAAATVTRGLARAMYRVGLRPCARVFVLNPDDARDLIAGRFVTRNQVVVLDGIGIDLAAFRALPLPSAPPVRMLMMARLLADKGVREFVDAATRVRAATADVVFTLAGDIDENPDSIDAAELARWRAAGVVDCPGWVSDVAPLLRAHHAFVLPSRYREGVPRTLLEALASARAVITTDHVGCRETVRDPGPPDAARIRTGENGLLVPVDDVEALAVAMQRLVASPETLSAFGEAGRRYAEERFDARAVDARILDVMGI